MTEKEQLRRLKAFVSELIDRSETEFVNVDDLIMKHELQKLTPSDKPYPVFGKADWLKDENE